MNSQEEKEKDQAARHAARRVMDLLPIRASALTAAAAYGGQLGFTMEKVLETAKTFENHLGIQQLERAIAQDQRR